MLAGSMPPARRRVVAIGRRRSVRRKHRERPPASAHPLSGVPAEFLRDRRLGPSTTGFTVQHDLAGAAELALRLQPSTRRLVVISGSSEFDRTMGASRVRSLAPPAPSVEYWQEASMASFCGASPARADDAVLYLTIGRDAGGRSVPRA
jgi:hypothetical protein